MWALILLLAIVALVLVSISFANNNRKRKHCASSSSSSSSAYGDSSTSGDDSAPPWSSSSTPHGLCGIEVLTERLFGGPLTTGMRVSTSVTCPTGTTLIGGGASAIETGAITGQIVALTASSPTGPTDLPPDSFFGGIVIVNGPANAGVQVTAICADIC
jgi:hypothetical protein